MSDTLALAHSRPLMAAHQTHGAATTVATSSAVAWALGVVVAVVAGVAYAATLAPDIHGLDSPELTAAAHSLGIAHAPGYPLYTMLGWLFSHAFPVSNVAFRLNLFSALVGAGACVAVYAVGLRLTPRPLVAAAGALALALLVLSSGATRSSPRSTRSTRSSSPLIVLAALAWRGAADAVPGGRWSGWRWASAAPTARPSILYAPALVAFVWLSQRAVARDGAGVRGRARRRAGLLPLPAAALGGGRRRRARGVRARRHAPRDRSGDASSGLWHHVSAAEFRAEAFAYGPRGPWREFGQFGWWLAGTFLVVGLPLGVAGIVRQWRTDRALLVLLAGMALPVAIFFINYGAIDKEFMFLPVYVVWSLWMVAGMDWTLSAAEIAPGSAFALAALALPGDDARSSTAPLVTSARRAHGARALAGDA